MTTHRNVSVPAGIEVYFATRHLRCNETATKTPTACCVSSSPRAPTSAATANKDLDHVADQLDRRPRKGLEYVSQHEVLSTHLLR